MMIFFKPYSIGILFLLVFSSCGSIPKNNIPLPKREFRAVWITSVVNIDWPESGNDAVKKQQEDFISLLNFYQKLHFNAVIVQIRTAGDALYPSQHAPWSRFLTGKEGEAPQPYYDPLQWMIKEAHKRGFEFHAWLNPYRATFDLNTDILSKAHDYVTHPGWMVKYGKKYYYNPGLPEVQEHLLGIIEEIIQNYDIDAIHLDDYFYPYKIKGEIFDDLKAFKRYGKVKQTLEDWRRANINTLIKRIHRHIAAQKPWVQFGVSPFGVWRNASKDPSGSDTRAGQTTYDDLYADPLLWMQNGWIDYVVPQLYWSMEHPKVAHRKLIAWWSEHTKNTRLYIGNGAYKVNRDPDKSWNSKNELPKQLLLARTTQNVTGNVFFSARSLMQQQQNAVVRILSGKFYRYRALPPASLKASGIPDHTTKLLSVEKQKEGIKCVFKTREQPQIRYVVLYGYKNEKQQSVEDPKHIIDLFYTETAHDKIEIVITRQKLKHKKQFAITYIDLYGKESKPFFFKVTK